MTSILVNDHGLKAKFSGSTGLLKSISVGSTEPTVDLDFVSYGTVSSKEKSGAYLFLPDGEARTIIGSRSYPPITITVGPLVSIHLVISCVHTYIPIASYAQASPIILHIWLCARSSDIQICSVWHPLLKMGLYFGKRYWMHVHVCRSAKDTLWYWNYYSKLVTIQSELATYATTVLSSLWSFPNFFRCRKFTLRLVWWGTRSHWATPLALMEGL